MHRSVWMAGALVVLVCVPAMAQRGGPGGPGGRGPGAPGGGFGFGGNASLQLVAVRAVQEELGLSEDQVGKLRTLREEFQEKQRASRGDQQGFRDLSEEQRRERMTAMMEANRKLNAEFEPKIAEILDDVQVERLQQIKWQAAGIEALRDEEVSKKLSISQEQQDKIAGVFREFQEKQREAFGAARGDREAAREGFERARELRETRDKQALDVLTDSQKKQFEELKGEPFDLASLRRGPGGRGAEGAGPGQRPGRRPDGAGPGQRPEGAPGRGRNRGEGQGRPQRPEV